MAARRAHFGALWRQEQICIRALVRLIPRRVTPDHLSAFALVGALSAGLALVACQLSAWFLPAFYLGLIANWFGDSLDGAIARHRRIERHRAGFLIDRCGDVLSFCIIIPALGLSPYLSFHLALMLLVGYLVHAIYGLMRMVVDGMQFIGLGGIGATEGRILIGLWVGVIQITHSDFMSVQIGNIDVFDIIGGVLLVGHLALFVQRVASDIERFNRIEYSVVSLQHSRQSGDSFLVVHEGVTKKPARKSDASLERG